MTPKGTGGHRFKVSGCLAVHTKGYANRQFLENDWAKLTSSSPDRHFTRPVPRNVVVRPEV